MAGERLTRDLRHSMIGGVCAGFARRYGLDVTLVRVVFLLLTVATAGVGVPVYIAAWLVMPREEATVGAPFESPEHVADEMRRVSDRLVEAAHVLADKTREAAEEISEIARRGATARATQEPNGGVSLPQESEPTSAEILPTPPPS